MPISGAVEDGNQDDPSWNTSMIAKFTAALSQEQQQKVIYIADAAVVNSTSLTEVKETKLQNILSKEYESLQKNVNKASQQRYACQKDAEKALKQLTSKHKGLHTLLCTIESEDVSEKRKRPGRPAKDEQPPVTIRL